MFLLSVVLPRSLRTGVGRGAVGNCSLCVCLATCSSASQPCNIRGWADTSVCCEKVQAIMSEGRKGCGGVTKEFPAAQTWGFLLGANTPCFLAAAACSLPCKKVCVCCCEFCVSKLGLSSSAVHVGAFCLVLLGRVSTVCMRGHRRQAAVTSPCTWTGQVMPEAASRLPALPPQFQSSSRTETGSQDPASHPVGCDGSTLSFPYYCFGTNPVFSSHHRHPDAHRAGLPGRGDHAAGPGGGAERRRVPGVPLAPQARAGADGLQRCAAE